METTLFNVYDNDNLIELVNGNSKLVVSKFGAHVISWQIDENEMLWISNASVMDGKCPIRGGIPICFPQFADNGPLKLHGFARETMWTVIDSSTNKASLELHDSSKTKDIWSNSFILKLSIELLESSLIMTLDVTNPSKEIPLEFSACFHNYFKTLNSNCISLLGLERLGYIDKPDERKEKVDGNEALTLQKAVDESKGQLDRIYRNAPDKVELRDASRSIIYMIEKSVNITDYVVFNPGINGKRGAAAPDFDDDGYNYMFCVEPAIAVGTVKLLPLQSWSGKQIIKSMRQEPPTKESLIYLKGDKIDFIK